VKIAGSAFEEGQEVRVMSEKQLFYETRKSLVSSRLASSSRFRASFASAYRLPVLITIRNSAGPGLALGMQMGRGEEPKSTILWYCKSSSQARNEQLEHWSMLTF